jgi:uncharacterized Fe-S cluster-containing radical SAM superfamily protein
VHELIVSPFVGEYLVLRPGSPNGLKIPHSKYLQLGQIGAAGGICPAWLVDAARQDWDLEISGRAVNYAVIVRTQSTYGYGRASYELNLGCNYDCEHCYLGLKTFSGLSWPQRERLLHIMREAGVLWLQLTGGEPLIDKLFPEVYQLAYQLGMMISISSNGSRLSSKKILELLTTRRPYRLTLSVYGVTAESYDGLTRRRGSFAAFTKGLTAAHEAGLPINLNLIVARRNDHEIDQMIALAESYAGRELCVASPRLLHYGADDLRRPRELARAVRRAPAQAKTIYRLQRRPHVLPCGPARHGQHLQGGPGPPDPADGGRNRGAEPPRCDRRLPTTSPG